MSVSVGSRLGKPRLRDLYRLHIPATIVPQRSPRPAAPAHLHSHIRPPRHHHYHKQLSTSSSSSGCACISWNSATGAAYGGGGGLILTGEAGGGAGLNLTQVHYVTVHSAAEPRKVYRERVRRTPGAGSEYAYRVSVQD